MRSKFLDARHSYLTTFGKLPDRLDTMQRKFLDAESGISGGKKNLNELAKIVGFLQNAVAVHNAHRFLASRDLYYEATVLALLIKRREKKIFRRS